MSGASFMTHGASTYTVTLGDGGGEYGFSQDGGYGAISPASFKGVSIRMIESDPGIKDLEIRISADVPQDFFDRIRVQEASVIWRTFTSSSATYSPFGGAFTQWVWGLGVGTDPVWSLAGTTRLMSIS